MAYEVVPYREWTEARKGSRALVPRVPALASNPRVLVAHSPGALDHETLSGLEIVRRDDEHHRLKLGWWRLAYPCAIGNDDGTRYLSRPKSRSASEGRTPDTEEKVGWLLGGGERAMEAFGDKWALDTNMNKWSRGVTVLLGNLDHPSDDALESLAEWAVEQYERWPNTELMICHQEMKNKEDPPKGLADLIVAGQFDRATLLRPQPILKPKPIVVKAPRTRDGQGRFAKQAPEPEAWKGPLPSWCDLARKGYARDRVTVARVEQYRSLVEQELGRRGLGDQVDVALVVMACESGGKADKVRPGGDDTGLYQFVESTWRWISDQPVPVHRFDPKANIAAMAKLVEKRGGWRDWAGGTLSDGSLWGSGPHGHGCWKYPEADAPEPEPWYAEARDWAMEQGITTDGDRPDEPMTRAEMWETLRRHEARQAE